jgi:peptidoglycan/LPS O-acetylase OafA/YrhL
MNSSENKPIAAAKISNLAAIDIMRGISALGVVWFHSRSELWIGFKAINADRATYSVLDQILSYFSLPASQMGGMVMLFFVLSGFCIHLPTARKKVAPIWSTYAVRRFLRIYPPYFAVIVICLLLANTILNSNPGEFEEWNTYGLSMLMIQNWAGSGAQITLNPSLWTIPVEIALYACYPISLFIRRRFGISVSIAYTLFLATISIALFAFGHYQSLAGFLSYVVIWNSGAWLAEAYQDDRIPRIANWHCIGLILVLTVSVLLAGFLNVNAYYIAYGWGLIAFLLIIWCLGTGSGIFSRAHWLTKAMVFVGTISYSLYLIHYPLFKLMAYFWIQLFGSKPASFLVPSLATIAAIPISWIFYIYFEMPSHSISRRFARPS